MYNRPIVGVGGCYRCQRIRYFYLIALNSFCISFLSIYQTCSVIDITHLPRYVYSSMIERIDVSLIKHIPIGYCLFKDLLTNIHIERTFQLFFEVQIVFTIIFHAFIFIFKMLHACTTRREISDVFRTKFSF